MWVKRITVGNKDNLEKGAGKWLTILVKLDGKIRTVTNDSQPQEINKRNRYINAKNNLVYKSISFGFLLNILIYYGMLIIFYYFSLHFLVFNILSLPFEYPSKKQIDFKKVLASWDSARLKSTKNLIDRSVFPPLIKLTV